ncbi:hypothetical protein HER39_07855, partial [Arthrobacter deserti]|nr:hypothetical protein [Arthrobacter deserti]
TVTVTNTGPDPVTLSASVTGTHAGEFAISGGNGASLAPGAATTVSVTFRPGSTVGQRQAVLHLAAGDRALDVGLYGLTMNGIEGLNDPTLANVMGTLGPAIDVGWLNREGGVQPAAKGDEVLEPPFVKSGAAPVTMVPLAQYAPREDLPFGWYTGNGTTAERHALGSIAIGG